jgi:hypothetical protein
MHLSLVSAILLHRFEALRWWHGEQDDLLVHALYEVAREQRVQQRPFLHDGQ